jgi:hypothetical protein
LPVTEGHRLLDVGEELELVLDVFRRVERSGRQLADILGPVDDLQVALGIEDARVAGHHPAVRRQVSLVFSSSP